MAPALKTVEQQLQDAMDIIKKKNAELLDTKRVIQGLQRAEDTAEKIRQEIYSLAAHTLEPPRWLSGRGVKNGARGGPVTIWSDFHYGERVFPDQIGGVNEFNTRIAKDRFTRLVNITIDLCENHMGRASVQYPGIVVCLGGDMISGDIHEELAETNDRTPHQAVNDLSDMIAAGLERMADKFGKVFVPCVVGNHGRSTKKMRMKGRVYTSFDWNIYCNLERHFRKDPRVQFHIPVDADAHFEVYGERFLLTHGDSLGTSGGDGIIGAIGPIMRGTFKVGRSEAAIGADFDHLLMGHYHQMLWLPSVIVNGALKGYDEYAKLKLRAPFSRASQALFFVHPEHGITARWEVLLQGHQTARETKEWIRWR
jgi:predicted phosphodiesterase